jgi:hypothetical protein
MNCRFYLFNEIRTKNNRPSLTSLMMGQTERIPSRLWNKVLVVTVVEGDGDLGPLKVLKGGG